MSYASTCQPMKNINGLKETLRGNGQKKKNNEMKILRFLPFSGWRCLMTKQTPKKKYIYILPVKSGKNGYFFREISWFCKKIIMDFWHHSLSFWPIWKLLGLFYSQLYLVGIKPFYIFIHGLSFSQNGSMWQKTWENGDFAYFRFFALNNSIFE